MANRFDFDDQCPFNDKVHDLFEQLGAIFIVNRHARLNIDSEPYLREPMNQCAFVHFLAEARTKKLVYCKSCLANDVADVIHLSVRKSQARSEGIRGHVGLLLRCLAVIGLVLCWRRGGLPARRDARLAAKGSAAPQKTAVSDLLHSLAISLLYALVMFALGLCLVLSVDLLFSPDAGERELVRKLGLGDGYGTLSAVVALIFLSFLSLVFSFIVALFAAVLGRRGAAHPANLTHAVHRVEE